MILRNSIRQLLRTPVKAVLFILLLAFSALLLALGGSLNVMTNDNLQRLEEVFTTVACVEQAPSAVRQVKVWDAKVSDYKLKMRKEYGDNIPLSVLDMEGAEYLSGPERRPYYVAYDPSFQITAPGAGWSSEVIVEAEPYEDCVPNGPVKMKLKNVLYEYFSIHNMYDFYYCDHNNPNPEMLYAGKTYVMYLIDGLSHEYEIGGPLVGTYEWVPAGSIHTDQTDEEGNALPNTLSGVYYEEVTEGFYETERGKQWLELVSAIEWRYHSVPVTPVSDLNLLMPFYTGDAYLADGTLFQEEDYEEGRKVCLISQRFARNNGLSLQDKLPLSLVFANYDGTTAGDMPELGYFKCGLLNAQGKAYKPFMEDEYTIIGIYNQTPGTGDLSDCALAPNEVLVPAKSVTESAAQNIAGYGPMKAANVSFQIPNGTIERYRQLWEEQGVDGLEFRFYDKGYTRLKEDLDSMKRVAVVLMGTGVVTVLSILLFFCHLFITKQGRRTAIERSLGMKRSQCAASLFAGVLTLVLAGSVLGSIAGYHLVGTVTGGMQTGGHFDTSYSSAAVVLDGNEVEEITLDMSVKGTAAAASGVGILLAAALMSAVMIRGNLKKEPLEMLGVMQYEK